MADCSEKRPFICERSATRLRPTTLQEKLPATQLTNDLSQLTNDLSQSLAIFKRDLSDELRDTSTTLETHSLALITIIQTNRPLYDSLIQVVSAINLLKSRIIILDLTKDVQCTNVKVKQDDVLAKIEIFLQNESAFLRLIYLKKQPLHNIL